MIVFERTTLSGERVRLPIIIGAIIVILVAGEEIFMPIEVYLDWLLQ